MPGGYLYGWPDGGPNWVKIACNAAGKILADVSAFFENTPSEGVETKGPSSKWAWLHKESANVHHEPYTDVMARAAIGNKFDSTGKLLSDLNCNWKGLKEIDTMRLRYAAGQVWRCDENMRANLNTLYFKFTHNVSGLEYGNLAIYDGTNWYRILDEYNLAEILTAHYGTQYWSCAGVHFDAFTPDSNVVEKAYSDGSIKPLAIGIYLVAAVLLPDGAPITGAIVYGDVNAQAEIWALKRVLLTDGTTTVMATENIGTEDIIITNPVVDNSTYHYYINTDSMDTGDKIYGARIKFTL